MNEKIDSQEIISVAPPGDRAGAEGLLRVVEPAARAAESVAGFVASLAILSAFAGLVLFLMIFLPFESPTLGRAVVWSVSAFCLGLPGVVLAVFWLGLKQLIAIPNDVGDSLEDLGVKSLAALRTSGATAEGDGRIRRLVRLVRSLVDVRSTLLQSKELMIKATVLVRVANPITLVLVLAATVGGLLLIVATAIVGLVLL